MPTYYGQNREDEWIDKNLQLPEKGFYVDIGCGDPFVTSNTAFLRDRKWEGLAIDASLGWSGRWEGIPAFVCAVISSKPEVIFFEDPDNAYWSRIRSIGELRKSETVEELLSRFGIGKIDLLSVDTEGTELEVIRMLDFEKHDPPIVIVEYNAGHLPIVEPKDSPIPDFMRSKGYELKQTFGIVNMVFSK